MLNLSEFVSSCHRHIPVNGYGSLVVNQRV
ncbi:protein of unknown function [Pararobbsia alpina]